MPRMNKILIVDDDPELRDELTEQLSLHEEFEAVAVENGSKGMQAVKAGEIDLVIMDIGLPDIDGREAVRILRKNGFKAPIIMLTGHGTDSDTILGFDSGANDYVTKPFGMDELLARMRAALRHQLQSHGERPVFRAADLSVDLVRRIVKVGDKVVKLSPKEYDLLRVLVQHAGKVLTHKFLLTELWGDLSDAQYLRVYVRQLRQKLEDDPEKPKYIHTETGIGYRLCAPE